MKKHSKIRIGYVSVILALLAYGCGSPEPGTDFVADVTSDRAISTASIGNPIIKDMFTADAAALVYNDTVYLYTGVDEAGTSGSTYVMNSWRCFSSTDMKTWTDRGSPLDVSAFSWASGDAWASQVVYRNGKFYWYVSCTQASTGDKAIGVAVSTSPTGPFTDAIGAPLITNDQTTQTSINWDDIDPTVFIDDDDQAYMYWGNTVCKYVILNSDMISTNGEITPVSVPNFTEAPWLHKHNGTYYLSYAYDWPESIAYATSTSPTGPWTYQGIIMKATPTCGTNHQAIIEYNGTPYFFYHNGSLPTGGDYRRSVCLEKFAYNSDGTIPTITETSTGVGGESYSLQSYNFTNRLVRHQNFDVQIDSSVSPALDAQWQIVPGLADSSEYISLQSVNYPGYYLRHYDFDFVLAKNDGTTQFAKDATFKEVPGLADSSWSSFTSYNYPTYYIRHYDYKLILTTISTALDEQDATFRVVD